VSESTVGERIVHQWYSRPVLFVSDLQAALRFYIDKLGFEKRWHTGDGKGTVCQVDRGGCEVILCEDATRQDRGRLFVELNRDGINELRRDISERSVPIQKVHWGYDVIQITDPDGNELFFPLDETNSSER
jgi:catechol 2,3-dioxygenase-like lactoylglutathione lyase family enzyme